VDQATVTSDRELWRRAVGGDAESFGVIFDRHAASVHAYCRARAVDESGESAADLVSVVFLEAWRRRRDVVLEAESALPWLLGVARRVALHRARSVRRHRAALARLPSGSDLVSGTVEDPAEDIARRLDDGDRLESVRQAFGQLRESDREVLLLCVWGGLDYASAAVTLGLPIGTVRSRLARARVRLGELADAAPARGRPPQPQPQPGDVNSLSTSPGRPSPGSDPTHREKP
jgi:RNA polymerase sigma factor (sigma-70 family)